MTIVHTRASRIICNRCGADNYFPDCIGMPNLWERHGTREELHLCPRCASILRDAYEAFFDNILVHVEPTK